jgi:hypothetical protein
MTLPSDVPNPAVIVAAAVCRRSPCDVVRFRVAGAFHHA